MNEEMTKLITGHMSSHVSFCLFSVADGSTAKLQEEVEGAAVRTGATPQILPTRVSEATSLPVIQATRPSGTDVDEEVNPEGGGQKELTKEASDRIDYGPEVEQHFSFTNDLREGYVDLSPNKAEPSQSSSPPQPISRTSGEGAGAPRAQPEGAPPSSTPSAGRKSSPDIQELITGFVKLLNGGPGQSPRPVRTRINNRGPPRISDLPPLVLDPPPRKDPPPYPFERPEKPVIKPFFTGIPLPEQIVPTEPQPMRPPLRPVRPKPTEKDENKSKNSSKVFIEPTMASTMSQKTSPTVLGVEVSSSVTMVQNTSPSQQNTTRSEHQHKQNNKVNINNATTAKPITSTTNGTTTEVPLTSTTTNTTAQNSSTTTTTTEAPTTSAQPSKKSNSSEKTTTTRAPASNSTERSSTTARPSTTTSRSTTIEPSIVEIVTLADTHKPTKWNHSTTSKPHKGESSVL